jgi:hypothetical protein
MIPQSLQSNSMGHCIGHILAFGDGRWFVVVAVGVGGEELAVEG